MWNQIVKNLAKFSNAVLTGIDSDGYPVSIRCVPQVDGARQVLRISIADGIPIRPGPVGLLCHSHDEQIWNLRSFLVQGRLVRSEQGWELKPERFIPGGGMLGPIDQMRQIFKARDDAKKYVQKRGIPWPKVQWDEYIKLKKEALRLRRQG